MRKIAYHVTNTFKENRVPIYRSSYVSLKTQPKLRQVTLTNLRSISEKTVNREQIHVTKFLLKPSGKLQLITKTGDFKFTSAPWRPINKIYHEKN